MFKKALSVVLATILVIALVGCGGGTQSASTSKTDASKAATSASSQEPTASGTFKLGAFMQLTGGNSAYGVEAKNSVQLAVDFINEQGGFNGQKIVLSAYDTQGSPEEAVKIATKLIQTDKVNACIGSNNSSEVLAAAGYLNDAHILTLGMGTSPTWMAKDWPYVFRPAMNNAIAAQMTGDMIKKCGITSVAMFYAQDDASLATIKALKEACAKLNIEVKAEATYDAGDTDYSAQVAKMKNSGAQTVFISVTGETGPFIVKQLRQYGYNGLVFDKESFMVSQILIAGKAAATNILFANPYVTYSTIDDCDIDIMKDFLKKYAEKYGSVCKTDSAYRGWDAMMVLWEATKIAKSNDSDAIKQAMNKVSIPGLGGTLDFTKGNREGYNNFNSFILVDGKNILFSKWLETGGFDAYKKATGRSY